MASSRFSAQSLNDLTGLVAVVTGGGSGLGLIMAQTLAANGAAKVYITGRRGEVLERVVREQDNLRTPKIITAIQGDATSRSDLQRAVDFVTAETGYINLLICNAGRVSSGSSSSSQSDVATAAGISKPSGSSSIEAIRSYYFSAHNPQAWSDVLETNVTGPFLTTMAFLNLLDAGNRRRESGRPTSQVIAMGSVGGLTRWNDTFLYGASKAGMAQMMAKLGAFLVPHDVRVNVVAPGWFPSDMTAPLKRKWDEEGMTSELVPARRMGREEELAGTVLYLAGRAGGYCNGLTLVIDGGFLVNHAGS